MGTPAFHTPSGVSEPQTPPPPGDDSPSSPRAWRWPATGDTVLPPLNMQRGCSQPADGTSLSSQAPGQQECQSKGNSRRGRGLSQLGRVRQGTSSRGQPGGGWPPLGGGWGASRSTGTHMSRLLYPEHCWSCWTRRGPGQALLSRSPQAYPAGSAACHPSPSKAAVQCFGHDGPGTAPRRCTLLTAGTASPSH